MAELETETNINTKYVLVKALSTHMTKKVISGLDTAKLASETYLRENPAPPEAEEHEEFIALVDVTRKAISESTLVR